MYYLYWVATNKPHARYLCLYNTHLDDAVLVTTSSYYVTFEEFKKDYPEYFI